MPVPHAQEPTDGVSSEIPVNTFSRRLTASLHVPAPGAGNRATPAVPPRLSVVVPAYRCRHQLRATLPALLSSTLPRTDWELIVADDGSPDDTGEVARRFADRVVRTGDAPRGPAYARNCGAQEARADIVLFVDADVIVRPDVLEKVLTHFTEGALTAVFGCYDADPAAPGVVSQYRNLLHRYVHIEGAGEAATFWAGLGAVRRGAFMAAGGFHAARYPRPQIEDIDLGYRLRDAGGTMRLDPSMTGTHLKRWTLATMTRTDLVDRAIPWMQLLIERRSLFTSGSLNTSRGEQVMVGAMAMALLLTIASIVTTNAVWLSGALLCTTVVLVGNGRLFGWFAGVRGVGFALATVPLRLLFYVVSVSAAILTLASTPFSRRRGVSAAPAAPLEAPVR